MTTRGTVACRRCVERWCRGRRGTRTAGPRRYGRSWNCSRAKRRAACASARRERYGRSAGLLPLHADSGSVPVVGRAAELVQLLATLLQLVGVQIPNHSFGVKLHAGQYLDPAADAFGIAPQGRGNVLGAKFAVDAAGDHAFSVRCESHEMHGLAVVDGRADRFAGGGVPQAGVVSVPQSRQNAAAVRGKGESGDIAGQIGQRPADRPAAYKSQARARCWPSPVTTTILSATKSRNRTAPGALRTATIFPAATLHSWTPSLGSCV